jgi:hypothetical protein
MTGRRFLATAIVTTGAILSLLASSTAALAAPRPDTTPPSAPKIIYLQGYYCLTMIVGVDRSTDNRTPQAQLTYDVYADGQRIGSMVDQGSESGVWSIQHLTHTGPNTITVRAVDAAGNRSAPSTGPSTTNVIPGYPC